MSELAVFNSLSKEKETFQPISKGLVGMYVCGPTVYSDVHLGNIRTFMSFDIIFRYLKHLGYKVRYVRNITDVGHLVGDADEGEDKIAARAKLENLEPMEVVQKYSNGFQEMMRVFNIQQPSIEPRATGHIIEQIEMIEEIIKNGYGYEKNGSVYFDTLKFSKERGTYGQLSGRILEDLLQETRDLKNQQEKKNSADFAIWIKADERHLMKWNSPWSIGFPGWHLECSAMSTKYLGEEFDIHGGGMDLKFPHHECEIAQAKASTGHNPVRYWMHGNMLTLNGKKMAKSTGNNILPSEIISGNNEILNKPFPATVARFFMLQAHYRSVLDFSSDALEASEKGYNRLMNAVNDLEVLEPKSKSTFDISAWKQQCYTSMNDDFNTPILIAHLFEGVKLINLIKENKASLSSMDLKDFTQTFNAFIFDILGLENVSVQDNSNKLSGVVEMLIGMRNDARENKDWALSDKIRDELLTLGIQLKDGKDGTTFSVN